MVAHAVTSFLVFLLPIHITLHVCEPETACSECIESIQLWITVDPPAGRVWMAGRRSEGGRIVERLENCTVTDRENWTCGTATRFEAKGGVVTVTLGPHWAGKLDACVTMTSQARVSQYRLG